MILRPTYLKSWTTSKLRILFGGEIFPDILAFLCWTQFQDSLSLTINPWMPKRPILGFFEMEWIGFSYIILLLFLPSPWSVTPIHVVSVIFKNEGIRWNDLFCLNIHCLNSHIHHWLIYEILASHLNCQFRSVLNEHLSFLAWNIINIGWYGHPKLGKVKIIWAATSWWPTSKVWKNLIYLSNIWFHLKFSQQYAK